MAVTSEPTAGQAESARGDAVSPVLRAVGSGDRRWETAAPNPSNVTIVWTTRLSVVYCRCTPIEGNRDGTEVSYKFNALGLED